MAAGNLSQGALLLMTPTHHQFENSETQLTAKYSKGEPGSLRATQHRDRPRDSVNWSFALSFLPSRSSTLQQAEEAEHCETGEQTIKAFRPENFKAKSTDRTRSRQGAAAVKPSSTAGAWAGGIHTADWTDFYIHYVIHSHLQQACEQDMGNAIQQLTSTVHLQTHNILLLWPTAQLSNDCENTVFHTRLWWVERKGMARS